MPCGGSGARPPLQLGTRQRGRGTVSSVPAHPLCLPALLLFRWGGPVGFFLCCCTLASSGCPPCLSVPAPRLLGPLRPDTQQEGLLWELPGIRWPPASGD